MKWSEPTENTKQLSFKGTLGTSTVSWFGVNMDIYVQEQKGSMNFLRQQK